MKSVPIWTLLLALCGSSIASAEVVVLDTVTYNGEKYTLIGTRDEGNQTIGAGISWTDANAYAQSIGGRLAKIDSQAENDFLLNHWGSATYGDHIEVGNLWIGLNDQAEEGKFTWTDGSTPGFTNWAPGEPNNHLSGVLGEHYAAIIAALLDSDRGKWNDLPNTAAGGDMAPYYAVVETPEPASLLLALSGSAGFALFARQKRKRP